MALDFQFPPAQALKSGLKQALPITLNTPLQSAPQTVPVDIDWSEYGASSVNPVAVKVNLAGQASPGPTLDAIRSIYVDNSFSFVPIYVQFPGSEFITICPANSIGMFPVFASPGVKEAIVYAQDFDDGNLPVTTIHFSNVEVAGWVAGTGQFLPPVIPESIVNTDVRTAAGGTLVQTATDCAIGTAAVGRAVYVGIQGVVTGANPVTISGVTIGGVAATLIKAQSQGVAPNERVAAIYGLVVPAGITATVVVTFVSAGGTMAQFALEVYAAYNVVAPLVPFSAQSITATGTGTAAIGLPTKNNGVALVAGNIRQVTGVFMSGIANNTVLGMGGVGEATYGYQVTTGAGLNLTQGSIGADTNILVAASFK